LIPRLMAAQFVRPFRKNPLAKNDPNDAEAIATAARQGNMRFAPVKTIDQQARLAWQLGAMVHTTLAYGCSAWIFVAYAQLVIAACYLDVIVPWPYAFATHGTNMSFSCSDSSSIFRELQETPSPTCLLVPLVNFVGAFKANAVFFAMAKVAQSY
jgi:hypothetical protein